MRVRADEAVLAFRSIALEFISVRIGFAYPLAPIRVAELGEFRVNRSATAALLAEAAATRQAWMMREIRSAPLSRNAALA
jgi:hypothetical protein